MLFTDLPPIWQENVQCVVRVAQQKNLPANVLLAIASLENGKPGMFNRNKNGSYDLGKMQVNTIHLPQLGKYGIRADHLLAPGCYSIELAGWMLAKHLAESDGDFWTRAANYHSKTPKYNQIYRNKLIPYANAWGDWLALQTSVKVYPVAPQIPPIPFAPLTTETETVKTVETASNG